MRDNRAAHYRRLQPGSRSLSIACLCYTPSLLMTGSNSVPPFITIPFTGQVLFPPPSFPSARLVR